MSPELRCGHASDVRGWSAMAARGCEILGQWDSGDGQNLTQTPAGVRLRGGGRPADRSPRNPTSRWATPLGRLLGGAVGLGEDGARLGAPVFAWWRFLHQAIGFSSPPPGRLAALAPATCPDHVSGEGRLGAMAVIGRVARGRFGATDRRACPVWAGAGVPYRGSRSRAGGPTRNPVGPPISPSPVAPRFQEFRPEVAQTVGRRRSAASTELDWERNVGLTARSVLPRMSRLLAMPLGPEGDES